MIRGSFKSVRGVLKLFANSSSCKSSISTLFKLRRFSLSSGSPRTSLTLIGSNELSVSNLLLWGGGGGSNVIRGGRFWNLRDLLIGWSSTIINLTIQTLRSAKHRQTTEQSLQKFLKSQQSARVKYILSQRKLKNSYLASLKRFLGTGGGITHHPPTLWTRVTFQARPRWTRNSLSVYLCINPRCQYTRGYLNYINSLGGQSQAWFVRMGRVAKPETLSRIESPDA